MVTRHFPDWLTAFMELYGNVKAPDCYKYWTAMSTLAGAVERKVWWTNGTFWWYPNLYVFLVGERSSGKSTIAGKALDLLWEVPEFELAPTQMNEASLLYTLKDVGNKRSFEFHGKHYKNASFFMYGSEGAKLFAEMSSNSSIIPTVVELFNSGDGFWSDKPCLKKATRTFGNEAVFNPCINILACSTATWLMTKILSKEDVEGGLGSRILFAVFPDDAPAAKETIIPGAEHFEMRDKLLADLKVIASLKGGFTASPAWIKAFDHYNVKHDAAQKIMKFRDPMLQGCLARKANTHLVKLSILLAMSDGKVLTEKDLRLEERHCKAAWELLCDLEVHMPQAFGRYGVTEEVMPTHEVVRYLENEKLTEISLEKLCQVFSKQFNYKTVKEAIMDLCHQGILQPDFSNFKKGSKIYKITSLLKQKPVNLKLVPSEDQSSQLPRLP